MTRILRAYDHSIFGFTPSFLAITLPLSDDTKDDTKDDIKDGVKDDMKEMSAIIMDLLNKQSSLTQNEIAEKMAISVRSVSRIMKRLVETMIDSSVAGEDARAPSRYPHLPVDVFPIMDLHSNNGFHQPDMLYY